MSATIDLQAFIDGYKKAEVVLGNKKRVFREPKICDMGLKVIEILEKYCIEGERKEFERILNMELPLSKQKELLDKILVDLGLA